MVSSLKQVKYRGVTSLARHYLYPPRQTLHDLRKRQEKMSAPRFTGQSGASSMFLRLCSAEFTKDTRVIFATGVGPLFHGRGGAGQCHIEE